MMLNLLTLFSLFSLLSLLSVLIFHWYVQYNVWIVVDECMFMCNLYFNPLIWWCQNIRFKICIEKFHMYLNFRDSLYLKKVSVLLFFETFIFFINILFSFLPIVFFLGPMKMTIFGLRTIHWNYLTLWFLSYFPP